MTDRFDGNEHVGHERSGNEHPVRKAAAIVFRFAACGTLVASIGTAAASAQARPDLYVSDITVVGGAWTGQCNTVRATIRNGQNVGVSAPIEIEYYETQIEADFRRTQLLRNGIGPGASLPVTFTGVPLGGGIMQVSADSEGTVRESNERNNTREFSATSRGPCHTFTVEDVRAEEGQSLIFTVSRTGSLAPIEVSYRVTSVRSFRPGTPVGGTCNRAQSGVLPDYQVPTRSSVYFRSGQRSARTGILLCNDSSNDGGERVRLQLVTKAGYPYSGGRSAAIGTILEPKKRRR